MSVGEIIETGSTPHDFADEMRRQSSCIRSSVRATSIPPDSRNAPSSWYCLTLSSVRAVISFEWSTGKMKFDAWPVEPPGFGSGPLSRRTSSRQPCSARWNAMLEPTIPDPTMTTRALPCRSLMALIYQCAPEEYKASQDSAYRLLEPRHMAPHRLLRAAGIAVADRLQELAVLTDGILEPGDAVEREEPDPQGQHVVLVERRLEKRVVRTAVDVPVDALVEVDQRPLVGLAVHVVELAEQRRDAVVGLVGEGPGCRSLGLVDGESGRAHREPARGGRARSRPRRRRPLTSSARR